jgi:hypothetical protein
MIKKLETRGRKPIPENKRKKPVLIYLSTEQTDILGGTVKTVELLQSFADFKIKKLLKNKQNEKNIDLTTDI